MIHTQTQKKKPFEEDCFVYENQLNEPGYQRLKNLIGELFSILGIKPAIDEDYWNDVIDQAHKGMAKTTHEEFVKVMKTISPSIEVNGVYHNSKEKIRVTCRKCGYQWDAIPNLLLHGAGCRSCKGLKKKTIEEFKQELKKVSSSIEVIGEYVNTSTKVKVRNTACGHEWYAIPSALLKGHNCPICAGNRKKTHEQFVADLQKINPDVTVIGRYCNAQTKIEIRCNQCGKTFFMKPNSLLNGHGCSTCNLKKGLVNRGGKTRLKTTQEFISELSQINPNVEVLGEYKKSKEPIRVRCRLCGFEWNPQAGSLLSKHGCPQCAKNIRKNRKK